MVAYSFKARFCEPIEQRKKKQTIRAKGKRRHARRGDAVQLYTAMRTKHCRKIIPDQVCVGTSEIRIDLTRPQEPWVYIDGKVLHGRQNDVLAQADGFNNFGEMVAFWLEEHGALDFNGVIIYWDRSL